MNSAPSSVAMKVSGLKVPRVAASAVPTSTGATAAGSVRGRAAISQMRAPVGSSGAIVVWTRLRTAREPAEVGLALLQVRLAPLGGLLAHVEEQIGSVGQPLDPGEAVLVGVEARL